MTKPNQSFPSLETSALLDTNAAAAYLRVSKSFLDKKRVSGGGPAFCKVGRRVRYRSSDLNAWIEAHKFGSTSEAA